eukprot:g5977.t1
MHIANIRTAAAAAAALLAQSVGAFRVGFSPPARGALVAGATGVVAESARHVNARMMDMGATLRYCHASSIGSRGVERSAFCSRQQPPCCSSSPLLTWSRPRWAPGMSGRRSGGWVARGRGTQLGMRASGGEGGKGESTRNRILGTVVYLLPMLDGLEFGHDVFHAVPALGSVVHAVLAPALAVWDNVPFMPLVMFVILQVSVKRQDTSRFIRFNVQQAILVDILTVVLGLLGTAAGYVTPEGEQFMTNFAFYCLVGAVAYAVAETARGRKANQIPLISAAAEIQLGPS